MSSNTIEIITGISQAMSRAHDGATDESGDPVSIGLAREDGKPLIDSRVMDGFSVRICNRGRMHISYHCEPKLTEVHKASFESDIDSMVESVKSFIQKEYKKATKKALSLSDPSEIQILVEYISRIRTSVKAHKCYKIGGLSEVENPESGPNKDSNLDKAFKDWLSLGKNDRLI